MTIALTAVSRLSLMILATSFKFMGVASVFSHSCTTIAVCWLQQW